MSKIPPKNYIQAVPFPERLSIQPIGIVHSPYKERHGTPRQSTLRNAPKDYTPVLATIELFASMIPTLYPASLALWAMERPRPFAPPVTISDFMLILLCIYLLVILIKY